MGDEEEEKMSESDKLAKLKESQDEADEKKMTRGKVMGELLRSKGFIWIATSHQLIGHWQQAGSVIYIGAESYWMCEIRDQWKYSDRRQELVFIGQGLKHEAIQGLLDQALLTDEEMAQGPEKWEESMADDDTIQLALPGEDEEG